MNIRKDYVRNLWVIVSQNRHTRPKEFKKKYSLIEESCPFCPGNEDKTPPAFLTFPEGKKKWEIRVIPNKFPALNNNLPLKPHKMNKRGVLEEVPAEGMHMVIIETPRHNRTIGDFSLKKTIQLINVYIKVINMLEKERGIKYVYLFKNYGPDAGTSLIHSHTQLMGLPLIPPFIKEDEKLSFKGGKCIYCRIIQREGKSPRLVYNGRHVIAFTPYASRFNYELWIMPKRHVSRIDKLKDEEISELADVFRRSIKRVLRVASSYNVVLKQAARKGRLHLRIELCPRIASWGGVEISSGIYINSVSPEEAALLYKNL